MVSDFNIIARFLMFDNSIEVGNEGNLMLTD